MGRPVAAIDIDLTCVDIGKPWWDWMNSVTSSNYIFPEDGLLPYDLSECFKKKLDKVGLSGFDFFRQTGMYDLLTPEPDCVETLEWLSQTHDIVFVSKHKGNHSKSKCYWVKRHFPFYSGIILTDEKHYVPSDIFIDDRIKYHNRSKARIRILPKTPYEQDHFLDSNEGFYVSRDWCHIRDILQEKI